MNSKLTLSAAVAALGIGAFVAPVAQAQLVNLDASSFNAAASVITFSEDPVGTQNPSFVKNAVDLGDVTITFGGFFVGQSASGGSPNTLVDTTPTGPLTLDPAAPNTLIVTDVSNPTSPVLSGSPNFNGPISVLFSVPVAGVALDGGFFDAVGTTTIQAYDSNGNTLGSIVNTQTGIEFFGLADSAGNNVIQGISFFITGAETSGFAIDNLTFGAADAIVLPPPNPNPIPLPAAAWMGLTMLGGLGAAKKLRSRRAK